MTTTTPATRTQLLAQRSDAYDLRAAEFSRRQAILDVAGEDGRKPESELNRAEQQMFDDNSHNIRVLDAQIAALDDRIQARTKAQELVEAADARHGIVNRR